MLKIRKNDQVMVTTGKDRGKKGRVMKVFPVQGRILIEKINYQTVYLRKTKDNPKGGISKIEGTLSLSNVKLICPRCSKPARVAFTILADGAKQRSCKQCHEILGA